MKYDDASWHYGADGFPTSSPEEYGAVHIALFLRWCFQKGWAGELHLSEEPDAVKQVIHGEMSAVDFFFKYCDGKLTNEDFDENGNKFAAKYYGEKGYYLIDFMKLLGERAYCVAENEINYGQYSAILDKRYSNGKLQRSNWKFWE